MSYKYDITKHPNYKFHGNKGYTFDVQKYIQQVRANAKFSINENEKINEIIITENSPMAN